MTEEEFHKKGGGLGVVFAAVVVALLVAVSGAAYYFYSQYRETKTQLESARSGGQSEVQTIVDEVGKLMELPQDETPTLATIRSTENLQEHPFLSKGQIDDKLLIYTGSKTVIMYRPETKKIVAVGTVTIQQGEEGASSVPEPTPTPEPIIEETPQE